MGGDAAWADRAELVVGSPLAEIGPNPVLDNDDAAALVVIILSSHIRIRLPAPKSQHMPSVTGTTALRVVVPVVVSSCTHVPIIMPDADAAGLVVRLHPLLYEFLTLATAAATMNIETEHDQVKPGNSAPIDPTVDGSNTKRSWFPVSLVPLPLGDFDVAAVHNPTTTTSWYAQQAAEEHIQELPTDWNRSITLQILYEYDHNVDDSTFGNSSSINDENDDDTKRRLAFALQGRLILEGPTIHLLTSASPKISGIRYTVALVTNVAASVDDSGTINGVLMLPSPQPLPKVYRVGNPGTYSLEILSTKQSASDDLVHALTDDDDDEMWHRQSPPPEPDVKNSCPGYETLLEDLVRLLKLTHLDETAAAAPTGILLTGCHGVGKTRLVTAAVSRLQQCRIHRVSVHDLILQAAWAAEDHLMEALRPPPSLGNRPSVLVLDDLDAAGIDDELSSSTSNDQERRLVRNSITQIIDEMVGQRVAILGIGWESSQLPTELVRVGRLEKEISMLPPSQSQREQILSSMLIDIFKDSMEDENACIRCTEWAELLASMTAGCVAADLRHLCADAWNRCRARDAANDFDNLNLVDSAVDSCRHVSLITWNDLSEAARNCVPSQLAALDVTKFTFLLDSCSVGDWLRIHELSWKGFAGYANTKKRIYRTVVVPWRRLRSRDSSLSTLESITPPSGVLFHGPSGCGKTFAASCLGSSLGLPMIKIRAADVLDKWLGGSEAAIRDLFTRARAAAPSILFFDEIDAVASNRANADDGATADVMSRLLSTLLNEMDGVSRGQQTVFVIACTNRLESLDAALLRPGRLEEHILLPKPSVQDTKDILKHYLALAPLQESVDLDNVAQDLFKRSASGADINGTCREAVFRALRRYPRDVLDVSITPDDITSAMVAMKLT